jgi:hypothetical protein
MECKQTLWTIAKEFMNEFGLDFIFHYIRFHEREYSSKSFFSNIASFWIKSISSLSFIERMRCRIGLLATACWYLSFHHFTKRASCFCFYWGTVVLISIDVNEFRMCHVQTNLFKFFNQYTVLIPETARARSLLVFHPPKRQYVR